MSDLYLPDTPEGRAVEQVVAALTAERHPGQLAQFRKLARISAQGIARLIGADGASRFFAEISRDLLEQRGAGRGRMSS